MEAKWLAVTAVAPVAWGANYVVTRQLLPVDAPAVGLGAPRAAGRPGAPRRGPHPPPRGLVVALGGARHPQHRRLLPPRLRRRPAPALERGRLGDGPGPAGHGRLRLAAGGRAAHRPGPGRRRRRDRRGAARSSAAPAAASTRPAWPPRSAALVLSCAGAVLGKRWYDGTPLVAMTAWQLVLGGLVLGVAAVALEGAPPALDAGSRGGLRVHQPGRHRARLPLLVRRAGPAPGRHGRRGRAAQPGDRRAARRPGGRRDAHPGPAGRHRLVLGGILAASWTPTRASPGRVVEREPERRASSAAAAVDRLPEL